MMTTLGGWLQAPPGQAARRMWERRSVTVALRLLQAQLLRKPVCTSGRLPHLPRLGGCIVRQVCTEQKTISCLHVPERVPCRVSLPWSQLGPSIACIWAVATFAAPT